MSEPIDRSDGVAPSHEQLVAMFVQEAAQAAQALDDVMRLHPAHPVTWPEMAARLQFIGRGLHALGVAQAAALAAYSEAHPDVTVPPDGPVVFAVSERRHGEIWEIARESVDMGHPDDYAAELAAVTQYGHPQLAQRGHRLDEVTGVADSMAVLQYVEREGPDAVVRVVLGGLDPELHREQVMGWLADQGITPGEPRFYAPPKTSTFLALDNGDETEVYDRFGRYLGDGEQGAQG